MENYAYSSYTNSDVSSPLSSPSIAVSALADLPPAAARVKLMCSFGGKIQPRSNEIKLAYVGGETKILAVDRTIRFPAIIRKLSAISGYDDFILKYQFPGEDLDSLISVTNDDDLDHMMMEYDRLQRIEPKRIPRLRVFLFSSIRKKNQDPSPAVTPREAPDYLFGLDPPPEKEVGEPEPAPAIQRVHIGEKQQDETLARTYPPVQAKSPPAPVPEPAQACWQNPRLASIVCEDGKFYLVPMSQGVFPANYANLQRVVPPACNSPTAAYPAAANFWMGAYDNGGAGFAAYDSVGRQGYYTGAAATYQQTVNNVAPPAESKILKHPQVS